MLYYDPSEHGLETVHEYEAYGESYEFALLVVWRETATGKLWAATDSGCSCPVPFEDHTWPTDYVEVRSWEDVKSLLDSEFPRSGSYRFRADHSALRHAVQNAVNPRTADKPPPAPGTLALAEADGLRAAERPAEDTSDPGAALAAGDALQSAASRLAEWVIECQAGDVPPYEVHMAAFEARSAVEAWTEARRG